jgi:hypothetical protein
MAAAQHSAAIIEAQWDAFAERLEMHHPDERNRDFLAQFIGEDGYFIRDSKFALTVLRDELCGLIQEETLHDLFPHRALSVEARCEYFM